MTADVSDDVRPWRDWARRVVIHTTDYLDFEGRPSAGGRQRYIQDLAKTIRDDWGREVLVVQKSRLDFHTRCPANIEVIGICANLGAMGDFRFARRFRDLLEATDAPLFASGEAGWPCIPGNAKAIQNGIWWDHPLPRHVQALQRTRAVGAAAMARETLCVDTNFINWLRLQGRRGFALAERCSYVPNYADLARLAPSRCAGDPQMRIVCARRFEHKRGIPLLVEALRLLAGHGDIRFTAHISAAGGEDQCRQLVASAGLAHLVTVSSDDMDTVLQRYADANVAVVPTIWSEGTSLACVEAICAGVPVVATPVGGLGNLILPGYNGLVVAPTPEAIAAGLLQLADPEVRQRMSKNCLSQRESLGFESWRERVLAWLQM